MARKTDTFLLQSQSLFSSSYDSKDSALKDTTVDTALNSDMFMASAAIFIVLVLIWAHTGSLLLTLRWDVTSAPRVSQRRVPDHHGFPNQVFSLFELHRCVCVSRIPADCLPPLL